GVLEERGQLTALGPVERRAVDPDRHVLPGPRLVVLLAVVDGKAELHDLAAALERLGFRVPGQPADQHHLVQIRHGAPPAGDDQAVVAGAGPSLADTTAALYIRLAADARLFARRRGRFHPPAAPFPPRAPQL